MAKEIKMKKAATGSVVDKKEQFIALADTGEAFGNELIELLSEYGCSFEGLVIETYAMSKAWAALQAIAHSEGHDAEDLFQQLLPSFIKDMEGFIKELEEEEKK